MRTTSTDGEPARASGDAGKSEVSTTVLTAFGIAAVVVVIWHIYALPIGNPYYGLFNCNLDLAVYRAGGEALLHRSGLYDGPVIWEMEFTYTPFAAMVFAPLALVSRATANILWWSATFAALVAIIALSLRNLGYAMTRKTLLFSVFFALVTTAFEPVRTTIWLGQINVFLVLLVVWDLTRRSSRLRGVGVGLAAGIKLTPAFFLAYLALTRQWRTCATATAMLATTILLGFLVVPGDALSYWGQQITSAGRVGPVDSAGNQSLNGFLAQMMRFYEATGYLRVEHGMLMYLPPTWMWLALAVPVAILGLAAARVAHRRGQELLAISVTGMTSAAVSPFSWGHHWVWFLPLLVVVFHHVRTSTAAPLYRYLPIAVIVPFFCWWWNYPEEAPFAESAYPIGIGLFMLPRNIPAWWSHLAVPVYASCYLLALFATVAVILTRESARRW
ncbi:glycosyltransferase 87 family protein [Nocardia huaxiensis]|uniref:DUF2029 domain-containing protein n=1 Tax=Nocardia huaxiensis TaxID=2755382 RepID=A0A7D6ZES0_9NOCA|nr:glycosyltransferase 87 family protein [Nocardia huaxiensis]QLY28200.1 DUF2029 domain-containing protein [Nocardia huaxiensis]UFS98365.1 glycosyltransferase 87 family protein [Nocardia huaxiensis]